MDRAQFIQMLEALQTEGIEVFELVDMTNGNGSEFLLDENGQQVVNDVVRVGDGTIYIEREGNEPESEQMIVTFLKELDNFLPDIISAMKAGE